MVQLRGYDLDLQVTFPKVKLLLKRGKLVKKSNKITLTKYFDALVQIGIFDLHVLHNISVSALLHGIELMIYNIISHEIVDIMKA